MYTPCQGCAKMMSRIGGSVSGGNWKYAHGTAHYGRNFSVKWLKVFILLNLFYKLSVSCSEICNLVSILFSFLVASNAKPGSWYLCFCYWCNFFWFIIPGQNFNSIKWVFFPLFLEPIPKLVSNKLNWRILWFKVHASF